MSEAKRALLQPLAGTSARDRRDRLEILTALLAAPGVEPVYRESVLRWPGDHPAYGWFCRVNGCRSTRTNTVDLCHPHRAEWRTAKLEPGATRREFLRTSRPKVLDLRLMEPPDCRFCPERPSRHLGLRLCLTHFSRWNKVLFRKRDLTYDEFVALQTEALPGYGDCLVASCVGRADSPLRLCYVHDERYRNDGRPGGAQRPAGWGVDRVVGREPVEITCTDADAFRHWCRTARPASRAGTVNLLGLAPLVQAEIRFGMLAHAQKAQRTAWPLWHIQAVANLARLRGVHSVLDLLSDPAALAEHERRILRETADELRIVYVTPQQAKEAGFVETEHYGIRYKRRSSHFDFTDVPQRWLRDLLWERVTRRLRSAQAPRSPQHIEMGRRACVELGVFLTAVAPDGGHHPAALTGDHMQRFVADHNKRAREGLPSLAISRDGRPMKVTGYTRRQTFNEARSILRDALETGEAERMGLPREFIIALPTARRADRTRNPFPDPVARALADESNLQLLHDRFDPNDMGYRDIWEALVFTGRRASEIIELRLECTSIHRKVPFLWHDQTKVGNLDEAIRVPQRLYERLELRKQRTVERFEDLYGRTPGPKERKTLALFPSPHKNPDGTVAITYSIFGDAFRDWLAALDIGTWVPHQARHTLATNLLKNGAGLHRIKQYLGQISVRMAEHYAKVASSEVDDALERVWVSGPGSAEPGMLLASPSEHMTRAEAQAMAIDLARRSTPAEGGFCTYQPVVRGDACPWDLDCHNCDKFVMSGADLLYWRRKAEQWASLAERAPDDRTADYLHTVFEPTARAIGGLEKALAGLGMLKDALALDLRRPQDYFDRMWTLAFKASDLAAIDPDDTDSYEETA
ncbi:site-specific integrase [Streptomyces sp. NBC_00554]|uniref:tyrosine-type recombinase/integrase n=1 Tax=Streptomyces sp. NBC_00554 TaxID=2903661 RepID=UPI00352D43BC|nr:site-specific integrase [Streptomyces sp. NBC_00554]